MLIFTERLSKSINTVIHFDLALTAEQRTRSRQSIHLPNGQQIYLRLPRGTLLTEGDLLKAEQSDYITKIIAQPEAVITVISQNDLDLIRAAYHLGNRHVPIEITSNYLRFSPDPVLESMLIHLGLDLKQETAPFYPESGAYHSH
ncbi:MAG: urease accessory protein UreE [Microcoleaceae cyanobacterium]